MTIKVCDKCKTPMDKSENRIRYYLPNGIENSIEKEKCEINIHVNYHGKRHMKSDLCKNCTLGLIADFLKLYPTNVIQ